MLLKVVMGADHGGLAMKDKLKSRLAGKFDITDLGAHEYNADDDYPDFAYAAAQAVASLKADRGILVCGSGVGACIAANKVPGVRAGMCHDTYSAHQGVEHDNMNVLCLGARVIGIELACEIALAFLNECFSGEEKYIRRLNKVNEIEKGGINAKIKTESSQPKPIIKRYMIDDL